MLILKNQAISKFNDYTVFTFILSITGFFYLDQTKSNKTSNNIYITPHQIHTKTLPIYVIYHWACFRHLSTSGIQSHLIKHNDRDMERAPGALMSLTDQVSSVYDAESLCFNHQNAWWLLSRKCLQEILQQQ